MDKQFNVNTNEEIKVYNDFIDQVYNVYLCHLDMQSPEDYFRFKSNVNEEKFRNYKNEFDLYIKKYNEMLDTLQITVLVKDSLAKFLDNPTFIYSNIDSTNQEIFSSLILDSVNIESAFFKIDSLKSRKITFEIEPYYIFKQRDWKNMPPDTLDKYLELTEKYAQAHYGNRIDNKYYIGFIEMSRVKFNQDSTLCILECGYQAQSKCGYGNYYLLRKINGKWIVSAKVGSWVS